tara:strand:+ start:9295 stop:9573 length:279 start_codon:yes stop_codon:yes gene_type:complete
MERKIHNVRSPFQCKEGQFTKGEQDLCIGISQNILLERKLNGEKVHKFTIGKNPKIYTGSIDMIISKGQLRVIKKPTYIIPVKNFDTSEIVS